MPWWLLPVHKSYCMLTHICEIERNQFWAFIFYALYKFNLLNFKSKLSARVILVVIIAGYKQGGSVSLIWLRSPVNKLLRSPVFYIHMRSHVACSAYVLPLTRSRIMHFHRSVKVHAAAAHLPTRLHPKMRCSAHFLSIFTSAFHSASECDLSHCLTRI